MFKFSFGIECPLYTKSCSLVDCTSAIALFECGVFNGNSFEVSVNYDINYNFFSFQLDSGINAIVECSVCVSIECGSTIFHMNRCSNKMYSSVNWPESRKKCSIGKSTFLM